MDSSYRRLKHRNPKAISKSRASKQRAVLMQAHPERVPAHTDDGASSSIIHSSATTQLPPELLTQTFSQLAISADQPLDLRPTADHDTRHDTALNLLLVNKAFYSEATHSNNKLHFDSISSLSEYVQHLDPDRQQSTTSLTIASHWTIDSVWPVPGMPEYDVTPLNTSHALEALPAILALLPNLQRLRVVVTPYIYAGTQQALETAAPAIGEAFREVAAWYGVDVEVAYGETAVKEHRYSGPG
ncbi:hypothetical protein B0A55_00584 [Friedmanniomyces simplex]|uniref:Uncharacterized protein n=1 Tax=Friedmanniomyces simplex TaxID=329884 RepID=A0A4U0Y761_9PEZI|nr:hypothetical protein B0A55_00584 [Friedmanniomyces simplex]